MLERMHRRLRHEMIRQEKETYKFGIARMLRYLCNR